MSKQENYIDKKKEQSNNSNKTNNWKVFFISLFTNLILVLLWAFVGSNMVYFLHTNLDEWFPTNKTELPYGIKEPSIFSKLLNIVNKKNNKQEDKILNNADDLFKLREKVGFNKLSFPYTLINKGSYILDGSEVKNFFGKSARDSYITSRTLIKKCFEFLKGWGDKGDTFLFITGLFLISFIILCQIPIIIGFVGTLIGEINSNPLGPIIGSITTFCLIFLFGISIIWPLLIGITQNMQFIITMLILPLMVDINKIKSIIFKNAKIIGAVYGLLTILSAFANLDKVISIIMTITLISYISFSNYKK